MNQATAERSPKLSAELSHCSGLLGDLEGRINELRSILNFPGPPQVAGQGPGGNPCAPLEHKVDARIGEVQAINCRIEALNEDLPRIIEVVREI